MKLKPLSVISSLLLIASAVSAALVYQTIVKLYFEKEDVILIDGSGNPVTGQSVRISAPKARDIVFWNSSIGIKSVNPDIVAIKIYLNFTLHDVTAATIYGFDDEHTPLWIHVYIVAKNQSVVAGLGSLFGGNISTLIGVLNRKEITEGNRTICITTPVIPFADDIYWIFLSMENFEPLNKESYLEVNIALGIEYKS